MKSCATLIQDSAVEGILRSLRMAYFCCSRLISLQPINSPFGFGQYRLPTLHFAKSSNEIAKSRSLRTPTTAVFRLIVLFSLLGPHLAMAHDQAGEMRGMYRYMADAGMFTECLTGQSWFVAQEGDNAALEREYTKARKQPGAEILVSLEGRVEMRPGMEGNTLQPTLIVTRLIDVLPGETCGTHAASEPLENTYWKLTRLGDKPVFVQERQHEPSLTFHPENHRVSGSGGCNRLVGSYTLRGKQISFGNFATTKMACTEGMDTEDAFLRALTQVRTWKVIGRHLELYDAKGILMARFEARHPN